ncbi:unnamed protein product [Ilex paraguariensis]|uniref:RING-type E3 ubiquitin transferase n=1 Tax=Ilex paraguariensis TaxID=185542 RepID=A0ABC8V0M7_9AQUA
MSIAPMAQVTQLPIDNDGICMVCKEKPGGDRRLTCNTCVTPWHVTCLPNVLETLRAALHFVCPDCETLADGGDIAGAPAPDPSGGELVAKIRAIEADTSLTEREKAKKRQEVLSGKAHEEEGSDDEKEKKNRKGKEKVVERGENDVLDVLGENFKCSFCMQLPERPVTTPCGHNFCLKCFQKWIGQGKRSCAKCRCNIPPKMASQPRINSTLVVAIRMAKMSRSIATGGPQSVYHFVHNQDRPDKAYTTDRAQRAGMANAASGRIFVTVPPDHFGPILAENDPDRKQGVLVGECWENRMECRQWGIHRPHVAGIAGQSEYGAQSVVLSGGYEDDEDHGEWFLYTGSGGRDLSGNKRTNKEQSFDQKFDNYNEALRVSCKRGYPVRVVRSEKEKRSSYAPEKGLRYDGIYRIEKCWRKVGKQGFKVCRYLFVRCDNDPAPWTSDEHGDQPRCLPVIPELKQAIDPFERVDNPFWDYDEEEAHWKWKKPPPPSQKRVTAAIPEDGERARREIRKAQNTSVKEKLLKGAFAGQTYMKERTCQNGRKLRTQKTVMKCPTCSQDISEFLQRPQVNRELMEVIQQLQCKVEEDGNNIENSSEGKADMFVEESSNALSEGPEIELSNPQAEGKPGKANAARPSTEQKPKRTYKTKKNMFVEESSNALSEGPEIELSNPQAEDKPGKTSKRMNTNASPSTEQKPKRTYKRKKNDAVDGLFNDGVKENTISGDTDGSNDLQALMVQCHEAGQGRPEGGAKAQEAVDDGNDSPSSPLHLQTHESE